MKVLLDTHAFIWWDSDPTKLSPQARAACEDRTRGAAGPNKGVQATAHSVRSSLGPALCRA